MPLSGNSPQDRVPRPSARLNETAVQQGPMKRAKIAPPHDTLGPVPAECGPGAAALSAKKRSTVVYGEPVRRQRQQAALT